MMFCPNNMNAIIFDIDGTLIESLSVWADADREFLAKRGIEYDPEISKSLKHLHFVAASQYLIDRFSLSDSIDDVCSEITENVRQKYFHEIPLVKGAYEFIKCCGDKGIKMCAATSNSRELAEGALFHNGILEHLEFVITSDDVGSSKDSPEIFLRCCGKLGTSVKDTFVFEDSPHAAAAAKKAGFTVIGVNNGHYGDFDELEKYTDIRINNYSEITI